MKSPLERLWQFIGTPDDSGCWEWLAGKDWKGYGCFSFLNKTRRAHRFVYEVFIGEIPEGLHLDHLCRNRGCVNPLHLEPVTPLENSRRGILQELIAARTHCKNGHEYTDDNTYMCPRGWRECKLCRYNAGRRKYLGRKYAI